MAFAIDNNSHSLNTASTSDAQQQTMFLHILPQSEKSQTITIPLVAGHTIIDQQQQAIHQFSITNLIYNEQPEKYWLELPPSTPREAIDSLSDILMQAVAFQTPVAAAEKTLAPPTQVRDHIAKLYTSDTSGAATTYQAPLRQHVPPQKLALVAPTGDVLGIVVSPNLVEDPIPPTTAASVPVVVDTDAQRISLLEDTSSLTVKTAAYIGAGIVFGASLLGAGIKAGSNYLVRNTAPNTKPAEISSSTQQNAETAYYYSQKAVQVSHATVNTVLNYANQCGQKLVERFDRPQNSGNQAPASGERQESKKWKLVRNVVTVVDLIGTSLDQGLKTIASDSKQATTSFVGHRYGPQAQLLAETSMGVIVNATLVYIDARGISRRAIVKAVGKGAFKYHLEDGREVTMMPMEDGSLVITDVTTPPPVAGTSTQQNNSDSGKDDMIRK